MYLFCWILNRAHDKIQRKPSQPHTRLQPCGPRSQDDTLVGSRKRKHEKCDITPHTAKRSGYVDLTESPRDGFARRSHYLDDNSEQAGQLPARIATLGRASLDSMIPGSPPPSQADRHAFPQESFAAQSDQADLGSDTYRQTNIRDYDAATASGCFGYDTDSESIVVPDTGPIQPRDSTETHRHILPTIPRATEKRPLVQKRRSWNIYPVSSSSSSSDIDEEENPPSVRKDMLDDFGCASLFREEGNTTKRASTSKLPISPPQSVITMPAQETALDRQGSGPFAPCKPPAEEALLDGIVTGSEHSTVPCVENLQHDGDPERTAYLKERREDFIIELLECLKPPSLATASYENLLELLNQLRGSDLGQFDEESLAIEFDSEDGNLDIWMQLVQRFCAFRRETGFIGELKDWPAYLKDLNGLDQIIAVERFAEMKRFMSRLRRRHPHLNAEHLGERVAPALREIAGSPDFIPPPFLRKHLPEFCSKLFPWFE